MTDGDLLRQWNEAFAELGVPEAVDAVAVEPASCPVCGATLEMLRRYWFAPSLAYCATCVWTRDVVFDFETKRWLATVPDNEPKP